MRRLAPPAFAATWVPGTAAHSWQAVAAGGTARADDNEESLKTRLMEYYKKTSPLIGYYYAKGKLRAVDGLGEIDCHKFPLAKSLEDVEAALGEGAREAGQGLERPGDAARQPQPEEQPVPAPQRGQAAAPEPSRQENEHGQQGPKEDCGPQGGPAREQAPVGVVGRSDAVEAHRHENVLADGKLEE